MRRSILCFVVASAVTSCAAFAADLPNPKLTPGLADLALTKEALCAPYFSTKSIRRHGSRASTDAIYNAYGVGRDESPCPCEIDHLIPLEIGGSNDVRNLWPQPDSGILWNSKRKDELETQLHTEVCSGVIDLRTAQQEIAKDWIAAYVKRFGVPSATANRSRYRTRKTASP